ncbi:MAG TPA: ATP-binding protein [Patescibacteria group bacterium]|nr:ATP-binding protein [Patescibacteria group bacterium]
MKQLLENLVKEWWQQPLPTTISRKRDLKEFADLGNVRKAICIVGFRRVGKTFSLLNLAKQLGQENCVYINFEDERLPKTTEVLTTLLEVLTELKGQQPFTFLLDEIQNIPNWSVWVRRVLDTTGHKIFLSGSSSKLSSHELPTELRGRSISIKINPLSFEEFLKFKNVDIHILPKPEILNLTREYVTYGGFPEIVLTEEGKKPLIMDEYFQTFILRDLIERYKIRDEAALRGLIKLLANSSHYTISKLANSLKSSGLSVAKSTVSRYIDYLHNSYFMQSLQLHTPSVKNRLKAERKVYLVDSFLLARLTTEFTQNLGRLMEQVVAETLFSQLDDNPNSSLFYWKDNLKHEVDFVVRQQEEVEELIQASWISDSYSLPDREMRSLIKAKAVFACSNTKIVTWDLEDDNCLPLYKWLLKTS